MQGQNRKIVAAAGPTAVGKTEYMIGLALDIDAEIVSCDSMQLYKYMDIGSAKPTAEERAAVRHYLVDEIDPREPFTVAKYQRMAKEAIEEIFSKGKIPLVTGGTGLYLNSLLYDMDFGPTPSGSSGERREELYAMGIYLCYTICSLITGTNKGNKKAVMKKTVADIVRTFLCIVIPLLIAAALIETYVTPLILNKVI